MPRHHEIHANEFRDKAFSDVLQISSAHHRLYEQRLENEEPEGKTGKIVDDTVSISVAVALVASF
jgi:hypothetical protein